MGYFNDSCSTVHLWLVVVRGVLLAWGAVMFSFFLVSVTRGVCTKRGRRRVGQVGGCNKGVGVEEGNTKGGGG